MADLAQVAAGREGAARHLIETRVAERATRNTAEEVQETCSFARAERLLGREYHGRFLIELLQNAADAWRDRGRDAKGGGSIPSSPAMRRASNTIAAV